MRRITGPIVTVLALVGLAGCGPSDDAADPTTTTAAVTTTSAEAGESTTGSEPRTETTAPESGSTTLPGEPIELFPYEGAQLAVVGVDRDDVLHMRAGPGEDFEVLTDLAPIATGIVATGHNRQVDEGIWVEATHEDVTGWVSMAFVMQLGASDDVTDELDPPISGETMIDVAEEVGRRRADTEVDSRIAVIEDPEVGQLGSVLVDVVGFADDAVGGERLHVLAEPAPGGEGFTVSSVERIVLCVRGVSDDGLCT